VTTILLPRHKRERYKTISKALHISENTTAKVIQKNKTDGRKIPMHDPCTCMVIAHAEKDVDYWDSKLWNDETKNNPFGVNGFKTVWRRKGQDFKEKCLEPTVKHGGGSVLMWGCRRIWSVLHLLDYSGNILLVGNFSSKF
uniref:Transposase Tc1-like domain-containing protein n=1 Tax=Oryzias latipes TaxID=8090 RepID=A0A3P9HSP6_ORYLA